MRRLTPMVLPLVLVLSAFGCAGEGVQTTFSGEVAVGATFPLTGELSYYAQSAYYGVITRVRQINQAGGVNGKRLSVIWRDNRSRTEQAILNIEELVREHQVPAIIGPLFSDSLVAARPTAARLAVPLISPLASMKGATSGHAWIFGVAANNLLQAEAMAAFQMEKYGARTCAVIYDRAHRASVEMAEIFQDKFVSRGGRVTSLGTFRSADGSKDYPAVLAAAAADKPDFVFAPCYGAEAAELIYASQKLDLSLRFAGPEEWDNEELFVGAGVRLTGAVICSSLFESSFRYRPFQLFMEEIRNAGMDEPDAQAALAYDAVSFLAAGLAKSNEPKGIRDALAGIRNMNLATGRISIGPDHETLKPVFIRVVERRGDRMAPVYADRYDP